MALHANALASSSRTLARPAPVSCRSRIRPIQLRATTAQRELTEDVEDINLYVGESFYELLGVSPSADAKAIKKAYLGMMKSCHPDRMHATNEFCALINEIYETLSDPARRATYDALSGFSGNSINPFMDIHQERDQVFVDEFACIGCRNCCNVCPSTFALEDMFGRARAMQQGVDPPAKQQEAIDTCPVSCIHWVSASQLPLLEAAMARMERVAVWSMGMGGGSSMDVFTEASIAWQKRFQAIQARRAGMEASRKSSSQAAPTTASPWGGFWDNMVSFGGANGSRVYEQSAQARARQASTSSSGSMDEDATSSGDEIPLSDKEARNIASLAARAARASRTWRMWQQVATARSQAPLQLSSTSSASSMDELDNDLML